MYIQKIIFITLLTLIISCGGNYTGNEEEMVNSVSFELHPFLAVGHTGIIYTSRKGTLWHRISSGTVKNLYDVTYGKSKYIIVGSEGTGYRSVFSISANYNISKTTTTYNKESMFFPTSGGG